MINDYPNRLKVQLYTPYLPFLTGLWAVIPYPYFIGMDELPVWLNIFLLYPVVHFDALAILLLGRPAFAALACGVVYSFILYRYVKLAKQTREFGWSEDV
jgi:hypothetical protein